MFPIVAGALDIKTALVPVAIVDTTPVDGIVIDTAGCEGEIIFVANCSLASSGDTLAMVIKDSEDGTTFGTINADAVVDPLTGDNDTLNTVTASTNSGAQQVAIKKDLIKRYLRATFTAAGSGISVIASAVALLPKKNF